ncbi:MAG: hypothetical protein WC606_01660 [Candidatus Absconditabacterales bacterium]|jgi:hypothetical protein
MTTIETLPIEEWNLRLDIPLKISIATELHETLLRKHKIFTSAGSEIDPETYFKYDENATNPYAFDLGKILEYQLTSSVKIR